ncbi:MAG: MoaD/ThiS family protein [Archaeoglobaceae archaeon]|nr:MoaD/ThiS family protein [Archaeoglobaceae archaeon]MDW7989678.1 MoaD/ThiS family protein [Archaeoglobaceae archaeon]
MKLKLKFVGFNKKEEVLEFKERKKYFEILEELNINPETVVLVKGSIPVPVDDFVEEGELMVVRVISGGQ